MKRKLGELIDECIDYMNFHKDKHPYTVYKDDIISSSLSSKELYSNNLITSEKDNNTSMNDNIVIADAETSGFFNEKWMDAENIPELEGQINTCTKCRLGGLRTHFVFGSGNPDADVVVIGEAPGADEDKQGEPFVGRAGRLLTDILKAINFSREEIFICNILKCRPPDNRNPLPDEIKHCEPYLLKQLSLIKPKLILAVGTFAGQTFLRTKDSLGKMRGKFYTYKVSDMEIKVMVTYHPAALLRNPHWKRPTWEDVQMFRQEYDKIVNGK